MDEISNQSIEQLVSHFKAKGLSRARFMAILAGLGASTTGASLLVSAAEADAAAVPPRRTHGQAHHRATEHHNKQLHQEHVQRQGSATLQEPQSAGSTAGAASASQMEKLHALMDDYADNAVVEDPLFAAPIVGKRAIAQRKLAEISSMAGVTIEIVHRFAHRDQVVAEWIVRGTHKGDFMGFKATGRSIEIRGMTVVTREHGKITRESLYYDVADLYRQMA